MGSTLASNVEGEDIVWPSRETLEKFIKELRVKASRVNIPRHGQIMMKMSVLMNCMIPLLCHFMYKKGIERLIFKVSAILLFLIGTLFS